MKIKLLIIIIIILPLIMSCDLTPEMQIYLADLIVKTIVCASSNNHPTLGLNNFELSFFNLPAENGETEIANFSHFLIQLLKFSTEKQGTIIINEIESPCPEIGPGHCYIAEVTINFGEPGEYFVKAIADYKNEVEERNEDNNEKIEDYEIDSLYSNRLIHEKTCIVKIKINGKIIYKDKNLFTNIDE